MAQTDPARHGQKDFDNYFGPEDPAFRYDSYRDKLKFVDDELVNDYSKDKVSLEISDLEKFFKRDFYLGLNCPDMAYKPKYHYLNYLTRLQVLSYLFQSLREHEYLAKKFDFKTSCSINWSEQVKKCDPVTKEMQGFKRDAAIALKGLKRVVVPFEQSDPKKQKAWIKQLKQGEQKTLTHFRIIEYCKKQSCGKLTKKNIQGLINQVCVQEKELFNEVCSERDALYGVSNVPEVFHLVSGSSGMRGINQDGYGSGCLARFIEQNKDNEKKVFFLADLFKVLYEHNLNFTPDSPQGRLFTIGAVKEFTDKGLAGIFTPAKKTAPKKIKTKPKKQVARLTNPEFEKIFLPKVEKKKVKKKPVKKEKKVAIKKTVERKSSFLISSEFRAKYELDEVEINMNKFKYDYIFTLSQVDKLKKKVIDFSSIKSLKTMKKFDKLGSIKAPIPLKFIKFLIDNSYHKNLHNIIAVLGDSFFIFNDIDVKYRNTDYIQIKNDISTNFKWTIKILATKSGTTGL